MVKLTKVWLRRRWWDFRRGESIYLRLPISVLSYVTVIYTLLLERISFLKSLFPHFYMFAVVASVCYVVVGIVVGWLDRKGKVLSTDLTISTRENPIVMELLEKVNRIEKKVFENG